MNNTATILDELGLARANIALDFSIASGACCRAIDLSRAEGNIASEADARHLHAQILSSHGKSIEAIVEIKQAIELREMIGDASKTSTSLNNLGIILTEIGDFPAALESCFHSIRIKEELNDKRGVAATLINIGTIYQRLNNSEQELKMYERSLQLATEIEDKKLMTLNRLNIGFLYSNQANFPKAIEYLDRLDEQLILLGDTRNAIAALIRQGAVFLGMKQFDKAVTKYFSCLQLSKETGNTTGIANSLMNIGELKIRMGKLDEARPFIEQAVDLAQKNSQKANLKDAKLILSEYYSETSEYKSALTEYKEHIAIKEELLNIQNLKQLGELHLKYDLDKKEKEAEINHLKNVELKDALDRVQEEKNRSEKLLLNILPEEVAEELKQTGTAKAKYFEEVSVMFIDIKNFTIISQQLSPEALVAEIDCLFRGFDEIIQRYDVEKIKTIGDAYMCAGGIPVPDTAHAEKVAFAAIDILGFVARLKKEKQEAQMPFFEVQIGVNSGPVVAGIVGSSKFAYDIWGDTVNTSARMEQTGEVGKINISGSTYELLKNKFNFTYRGKVNAKNKGEVDMYFLTAKK